jgi:hypothetical protein
LLITVYHCSQKAGKVNTKKVVKAGFEYVDFVCFVREERVYPVCSVYSVYSVTLVQDRVLGIGKLGYWGKQKPQGEIAAHSLGARNDRKAGRYAALGLSGLSRLSRRGKKVCLVGLLRSSDQWTVRPKAAGYRPRASGFEMQDSG